MLSDFIQPLRFSPPMITYLLTNEEHLASPPLFSVPKRKGSGSESPPDVR